MSTVTVGLVLLVVMSMFLASGVWVSLSLAITGWVGITMFTNAQPAGILFSALWESAASWEIAALPLFIWMGEILFRTKLSEEMFEGLAPWLNWLPGRLMHVNILGCGIFGSVSGSSAATCATIAKVALPELKKRGYDQNVCLGSLAGAGTLGILIPPSITMVVYAVAADVSIIKIFLAGFLPGALLMALFSGYIIYWAIRNPNKNPPPEPWMPFMARLSKSKKLIPVSILIIFIVWVLIAGYATATEAAAFGVVGSFAIAWWSGGLNWATFKESLMNSTRLSCMIIMILAGAGFLTKSMAFTGVPTALATWVESMHLSPWALIGALTVVYLLLGTALDGISMIVLTTSIVIPMVQAAGFDLVWFGIFLILLIEIAEVTPPVGFNLFVLQTMTGKDSMEVAKASIPFFFMLLVAIVLITAFPAIVTILPDVLVATP